MMGRLIFYIFTVFAILIHCRGYSDVMLGIDQLFSPSYLSQLKGKRIGIITNHTAVNKQLVSTSERLKQHEKKGQYRVTAIFAPEHGFRGTSHANQEVLSGGDIDGIPIFSLHGKTKRPTPEMLSHVDTLIFDIQDIGCRSYTYVNTLFMAMEEAAKANVSVFVLDRPNPINGLVVDGPLMENQWRSPVGYINVPLCHGMTVGELANYFNSETKLGCQLVVVPMKGWSRRMSFQETGLSWIPTSPYIPEASSALYYPMTGIIGELKLVNIGIGYTLPFKLIGAPWIQAERLAEVLNSQNSPGVIFHPFHYRPFYGRYAKEECHGVLIIVADPLVYQPVSTQYLMIGILKSLYPTQFQEALQQIGSRKEFLAKVNGTEKFFDIINKEKYVVWKLKGIHAKEREKFLKHRHRYLHPDYQ